MSQYPVGLWHFWSQLALRSVGGIAYGLHHSSLSSLHGSMRSPLAIRAMLWSIETLRSNHTFHLLQVGPAHPALVRQRLLAQPARGAQPAHVLDQHVPQRSLVRS